MIKKEKVTMAEVKELRAIFLEQCVSLPKPQDIEYWSAGRVERAKRAIKLYGLKNMQEIFARIESSDFLTGRNGRWGKCGIDWILKPENLCKITEGNYDNRTPVREEQSSYDLDEAVRKATITARKRSMKNENI